MPQCQKKEEERLVLHLSKETGLEIGVFCPAGGEALVELQHFAPAQGIRVGIRQGETR